MDSLQQYATFMDFEFGILILKERFSQGNAPRVFQIKTMIASMSQNTYSVSEYYTKLKGFGMIYQTTDLFQIVHAVHSGYCLSINSKTLNNF